MYLNFLQPIFLTILAYLLIILAVRSMGRKVLSQMTFFDFIVGVVAGTVGANIALGSKFTSASASVVLAMLAVLTILFDYLHIKSFRFRKLVNSEPVVVIENGQMKEENMRKTRLSINDLQMLMRKHGYFNLSDVEFAIIETDGQPSVLPKSQHQPLTPADLKIPTGYKGLTKDLIIDGRVMQENLRDAKLDDKWLAEQLRQKGITDPSVVFYAGLDTAGNLYVSNKTRGKERDGQHGIE